MGGINRIILTGHLAKDPEIRFTKDEEIIATFTVKVRDISGTKIVSYSCKAKDKIAKLVGEYLKKGSFVGIEGKEMISFVTGKECIEVADLLMLDKGLGKKGILKKDEMVREVVVDNAKEKVVKFTF